MAKILKELDEKGLLKGVPSFVIEETQYLVIMGSLAYGVSSDSSDMDLYGFCIPPKEEIFPHLTGKIPGFDEVKPKFEQFQQHHINDSSALGGKGREYDITIYSIVKFFRLLMENNPNIIDSLFVPQNCILHTSNIGKLLLENRRVFLHKGCWTKFKGYAYSQLHKIKTKKPEGKRAEIVEKYGYDVKFAYHVVRLLDEVEQILMTENLDLQRNREQLKAIRRGEWPLEKLETFFAQKEKDLESALIISKLPPAPQEEKIRSLLFSCLEEAFGTLESIVNKSVNEKSLIRDIKEVIRKYE